MSENEGDSSNETPMATTAEVAAVVEAVQHRHRGRIRWSLGKHTAELAIRALESPARERRQPPSAKSRRRKRHKRLL